MRLKKKLPSDKYCTVEDFLAKLTCNYNSGCSIR
jgi:hypothetical protein